MADVAAGAILSVSFQILLEQITSRSGYVYDFIKGKKVNESLLWELERKLQSANSLMDDAEAKQLEDSNVRNWLVDLKATMCDAEDLVDEIDAEALRWESKSRLKKVFKSIPAAYKKHDCEFKAKELISRLDAILKQKNELGLKGGVQNLPSTRTPETSVVDESGVYGRDDDKAAILKLLLSDEVGNNKLSVIPIEGVGGLGKTTLARLVYNDSRVQNHFETKTWACFSDDFDILSITKEIFRQVTSKTCDASTQLNQVQNDLKERLMGKKFLIVLDDIWNEDYLEWDKLKSPLLGGARGSTIIVTTRSGKIANMMRNVPSYKLGVMSEDDCWSLFVKHAALKPGAHPELEDIGRQIVKKCNGLPLAVKALGGALRNEQYLQKWNDILKDDIWEWPEEANGVLPSLWLSYYYLPPHLKRCFAYVSIFPKDYEFEKEHLILLWMGENLLKPRKNKSIEEVGEEYFNILLSRSLFQLAENGRFIMHDLINDLSMYASCESCLRLDEEDLKDVGKATRRVSCMRKWCLDIENLKDLRNVEKLRTLLLTSGLDGQDFENYLVHKLESMRCLRVLEVHAYVDEGVCGIKGFKSIANLKLLRYLRFDGVKIEEIHNSFCTLYNLQTLILRDCGGTKLPDSIGKLKQLRHLDLSGCSITEIPDSICSLESLRHLDLSGSSITEIPDSIYKLHELRTLKLKDCGIESVPNSITMLTNLRQLILDDDYWWWSDYVPMPPQMSKLENLQTMPAIELGKDTGGNIKELGKLQHLQGMVCIGGLENVGNAEDARGSNLKDKKGITALLLKWRGDSDDLRGARAVLDRDGSQVEVLEGLQPHTNLEKLKIYKYGGTSLPRWFGYESFFIKDLVLFNCTYCTKLAALGQLPSLERLRISRFDKLERIGNEFYYSSNTAHHASSSVINKSPFKSLKRLSFRKMKEWKEWSVVELVEGSGGAFSNLETLELDDCPKLKWAFPAEETRLPSNIQSIKIRECEDLESFSEEGWPSNLTSLEIGNSSKLHRMRNFKSQNGKAFQRLTSLKNLEIYNCDQQLQCLGEETLPSSLSELRILHCPLLEPRCQRETGEDWSKILHIPRIYINYKRI